LVVIGGVGTLALAGLGGSPRRAVQASTRSTTHAATATHTHAKAATPKPATTSATATTAASTTSTTPAAPSPPTAEQLQATGHSELTAGNYPQAIATLRKALAAADPSSLTYAYGLYDLGIALLKSGNAAAAVPVLEQRIKIPNQTPTVQAALNEALVASGQAPPPAPGPGNGHGKGKAKGHDQGHGPSGGAGLAPSGTKPGDEHTNFVD
jgi:Flp pilus assembly protein TadD